MRGLTQEEFGAALAQELGKSEPIAKEQVSKWETGAKAPRPATISAIARLYKCSVNDLYAPPGVTRPDHQESIDKMLVEAAADPATWATARNIIAGLLKTK